MKASFLGKYIRITTNQLTVTEPFAIPLQRTASILFIPLSTGKGPIRQRIDKKRCMSPLRYISSIAKQFFEIVIEKQENERKGKTWMKSNRTTGYKS